MVSAKIPYPIYLLTLLDDYHGDLIPIKDMNELPKFFQKKEKMLNVKEQNALAKVKIYQTKLFHTNILEQMKKIKLFSKKHKELFLLSKEGSYLEQILAKIEKQNG